MMGIVETLALVAVTYILFYGACVAILNHLCKTLAVNLDDSLYTTAAIPLCNIVLFFILSIVEVSRLLGERRKLS